MSANPVSRERELKPLNIRELVLQALLTSVSGFIWCLMRGESLGASLSVAVFLFLLISFIRLMWIMIPRLKARGW